MRTEDFDFELPPDRIAAAPARPRDSARLLVVREGGLADCIVHDLPGLLRTGDLLVFNDTRVIPARLVGRRGAARVEILLHKPLGAGRWQAFARPAKRLRPGERVAFATGFAATVQARLEGGEVALDFGLEDVALAAALRAHGAVPLPPYIPRPEGPRPEDQADYQTMFARHDGSVAAPTAGLHFTPALMAALAARGVGSVAVTLHVGAGTFLPVRTEDVTAHRMHAERGEIAPAAAERINAARRAGGRIVAVGTTSLRLLESAVDDDGRIRPFAGETEIFILPGFRFRAVDLLMTNFHLPRSTLFMLVSAFAGRDRMRAAYAHAIAAGYRFYSYGDASLLERAAPERMAKERTA
ncbi:MAG: tRNA preQ1(34) S-adenosylmethionine ribosyltransferase-isomerase QueA [Alphaproteobacteria bacterium]|nr:tRNA preQ1(34) S-adenosylmethionine ribosyltransferase-isomerase QueA [Alphaproteobacteria bacterium]